MWDIYINQSKNQKEIKYVRHIYLFCLYDKWNKYCIQELYKLMYAFYMRYKINILIKGNNSLIASSILLWIKYLID